MLTFLFGKYGTGKSAYIVEKIAENVSNKKRAYWLVPEQKALICERNLASALTPSAQLYAEVLNFTRLADKVFRICGGLRYNYIQRSGKSLVMYRALCSVRDTLTEYKITKGRERGCVSLFLDAIGELKSYCVTPQMLFDAQSRLPDSRLKNRIGDLARVFIAYEGILKERFDDPYDDLIVLAEKLKECRLFEGACVYINSFNGFTGAQQGVLREIISQADEVYISLDLDKNSEGKIQYAKLTETLKMLRHMCKRLGVKTGELSFDTDLLHKNPCLEYLSDNIWSFGAPKYDGVCEGITLMRPSDEFDECERVAGKIKELVMRGARYGEIAVIMRDTDTYRGIIDYCFDKYDIPYYLSASTDVASKPLVKMLYSAIGASCDFNTRDIVSFIRSGYADISSEDADELESYIYRWGIYGARFENDDYWSANPDGYITEPTEAQIRRLGKINDTRAHLLKTLAPLREAFSRRRSGEELCKSVYELMVSLKIRDKLKEEMAHAEASEAKELSQLYRAIMKALSDVADIMAEEELDREGFVSALSYVLDGAKVGTIPTGEDNVTIGEAGALRTEQIRYAFVIGVCEGSFPKTISGAGFFSDSDKIELETVDIILSARADIRADDELFNFKSSIVVPSHELTLSAPRADIRGAKREPSVAYKRVKELFDGLDDTAPLALEDKLYTERIAREYLSQGGREAEAIRHVLGEEKGDLSFSNELSSISRAGLSKIAGSSLYMSQSKIEKFVNCHFQYYCTYALGIRESDKITFGAREVGVLAHSVLEHFLMRARDGKITLDTLDDAQIEKEIDEITADYIRALYPQGEPTSKLKHLFARLRQNIIIYIREVAREMAQGEFTPELFELKFSRENGVLPLSFDAGEGRKITLSGIVDRVDLYRAGDTVYVRVVDYKTGEKAFSFDDFDKGLELQLFIYLFTLCKIRDGELKDKILGGARNIAPAGVMYFPMRLGKAKCEAEVDLSSDEAITLEGKAVSSLIKRNGVFLDDEQVLRAQDKEMKGEFLPSKSYNKKYYLSAEGFDELYTRLERTLARVGKELFDGDASASPLKEGENSPCKYCTHRAICRRRAR
ncbi:MAG: PD-(D/E)XK nuclease family protein [Clostridia bacterium]|nr:PD-(D/E)XK nuclease family protein [Clostridia bacterium]